MAERARAPFIPVPRRAPARASIWGLTVPVLLAARALGLVKVTEADFAETATRLDADAERCRPGAESFVNPAKSLALGLAGSIPIVWGSSPLATVAARRFADTLAANARYPVMAGALGEAGRGRVGLLDGVFGGLAESSRDIFADRTRTIRARPGCGWSCMRDGGLNPEDEADEPVAVEERRADAVQTLAERRGVRCDVLTAEGGSALERLASLIAVPDFASLYLALAHGLDPMAVPAINEMKELSNPMPKDRSDRSECRGRHPARSSRRWPPTSASRSPSSSPGCSPARRRCWPRPSTRSPTPATRCCCCSAAGVPQRKATPDHPFGYGRERYIYAFIVSIVLFSVGGLFALYEGYHKIQHPEAIESWQWVPVVVLVIAIGLEGYSFRTAIKESNHTRGTTSWVDVRAPGQGPGAAGGAAGGRGRAGRPGPRAIRRRVDPGHRQRRVGRHRHRARSACCWSPSR